MSYVYVIEGQGSSAVNYRKGKDTFEKKDICVATFYKTSETKDEVNRLVQEFKEGFEKFLDNQKGKEWR